VVDAIQLRLVDVPVQLLGKLRRGGAVVAERLLDDDARVVSQPGLGQALDDPAEQEGRNLEIEDGLPRAVDRLRDPLVRRGVAEVALNV
jgi:hypothetical protein